MTDLIMIFGIIVITIMFCGLYRYKHATETADDYLLRQKIKGLKKEYKLNKELERLGLTYVSQDLFDLKREVNQIKDANLYLSNRIFDLEDLEIKQKGKK